MNEARRNSIAVTVHFIEEMKTELESGTLAQLMDNVAGLRDEEQEYRDNMPEAIGDGEKGDTADCVIELLDGAWGELEELQGAIGCLDTAIEQLEQAAD